MAALIRSRPLSLLLHRTARSYCITSIRYQSTNGVIQDNRIVPPAYYPRKIQESSRNAKQRIIVHQQAPASPIVNSQLQLSLSFNQSNSNDVPYVVTKNNYHSLDHLYDNQPEFTPTLSRPYQWIRTQPPIIYPVQWNESSIRCGLLGEKLGMMQLWTHWGERVIVTAIRIHKNYITQIKHELSHRGHIGIQCASFHDTKIKSCNKSLLVHYKKAGVHPQKYIHEFSITPDAVLPVGSELDIRHFSVGQYIDVSGVTIGKGFAGGMKRWNFSGLRASHGVSVSHRSIGATGSAQTPGKVFKGKKMPGRMGNAHRTQLNNQIYKIDVPRSILYIKGHCVGYKGNMVILRDAVKKPFEYESPPPFPTYIRSDNTDDNEVITLPHQSEDPFRFGEE